MSVSRSEAEWSGDLHTGSGTMKVGESRWEGAYSFHSRFGDGAGANPEEFVAAAHAGCYSMAFSHTLATNGYVPTRVHTVATVHLGPDPAGGFHISRIDLVTEAEVPGIDEATFLTHAEAAKVGCPVSKLYAGTEITLSATLL